MNRRSVLYNHERKSEISKLQAMHGNCFIDVIDAVIFFFNLDHM